MMITGESQQFHRQRWMRMSKWTWWLPRTICTDQKRTRIRGEWRRRRGTARNVLNRINQTMITLSLIRAGVDLGVLTFLWNIWTRQSVSTADTDILFRWGDFKYQAKLYIEAQIINILFGLKAPETVRPGAQWTSIIAKHLVKQRKWSRRLTCEVDLFTTYLIRLFRIESHNWINSRNMTS